MRPVRKDFIMEPIKRAIIKATQLEKCILCGSLTDIKIEKHIDERYAYIDSAGQLCRKCYSLLYNEEIKKHDHTE